MRDTAPSLTYGLAKRQSRPRAARRSHPAGWAGAAWLDGDAARAVACDASITPVVTGDVDLGALDDLVRLCLGPGGVAFDHGHRPAGHGAVQSGAQAQRTGPDHHDIGVHRA